jgi:hypothetical protein
MMSHEPLSPLLDLDPDLGRLLPPDRAREARAELGVRQSLIPRGLWEAERLASAHPEHVGLLMLDGVIAREVLIADTVSAELLAAGDVVRPWNNGADSRLLSLEVRWTVLADARLAILDRRFAARLARFPEVNAMLLERLTERAQRMGVSQAICQLNGVDRRLLALFWQLAERWGRMTPQGVAVPMALSHRVLAQLIGARRPTVSTALSLLAEREEVIRRDDGTWLLTRDPIGVPTPEVERMIQHRRRLLPREEPAASGAVLAPPAVLANDSPRRDELVTRLERLRLDADLQAQQLRESRETARELIRMALALQVRRREHAIRANGADAA